MPDRPSGHPDPRTTITIGGATFDKISEPTPVQRRAFDLIKAPIPLALTPM